MFAAERALDAGIAAVHSLDLEAKRFEVFRDQLAQRYVVVDD